MKEESEFNYSTDINEDYQQNHQNLQKLFEVCFQNNIQSLSKLALNHINSTNCKQFLLSLLKDPQFQMQMKARLQQDVFISQFLQNSLEDNKSHPNFEKKFQTLMEILHKKSNSTNQSLTFFNQYVDLSNQIQGCFILKKGFKNTTQNDQNDQQDYSNGQCGLKITKYKKIYFQNFICPDCQQQFKNQAGLSSHRLKYKNTDKNQNEAKLQQTLPENPIYKTRLRKNKNQATIQHQMFEEKQTDD